MPVGECRASLERRHRDEPRHLIADRRRRSRSCRHQGPPRRVKHHGVDDIGGFGSGTDVPTEGDAVHRQRSLEQRRGGSADACGADARSATDDGQAVGHVGDEFQAVVMVWSATAAAGQDDELDFDNGAYVHAVVHRCLACASPLGSRVRPAACGVRQRSREHRGSTRSLFAASRRRRVLVVQCTPHPPPPAHTRVAMLVATRELGR